MSIIIVDIDGTIADHSHRRHFIESMPKDWEGYFNAASGDLCIAENVALVKALSRQNDIVFVTGRPERIRESTAKWLRTFLTTPYLTLFMRGDKDRRQDDVVKREILNKYIPKDQVKLVIDDRPRVIRMWREQGLDVLDVGDGVEF